ncbi:MAG TPA: LacI family DNA-binding transcriptional regulator [Candidatus Limnocylindrales bacterium]
MPRRPLPSDPRRPTSSDVAALAGVSRTTVSFVLNERTDIQIPEDTRQRVRQAAVDLGYHPHTPARRLAQRATRTLGFVLRQSPEQVAGDALLAETLRGISTAAHLAGYRVLVEALVPGNGQSYAALLRSSEVDGLVLSGPRSDDRELGDLVREEFPIVVQGRLSDRDVPSVDIDNEAGSREAVEHLIGGGHRRIACITNAPLEYTSAADRLAGYRSALDAAGIPFDPRLVACAAFDPASGRAAMRSLLQQNPERFSAVFVASDVVAVGAIGALREAGLRVPADVAVVGFDDIPLAGFVDPALTTVRVPAHELGLAAGTALLDRLAGQPVDTRTLLPTELVVRASSVSRAPTTRSGP